MNGDPSAMTQMNSFFRRQFSSHFSRIFILSKRFIHQPTSIGSEEYWALPANSSLFFNVIRKKPELVRPAKPTYFDTTKPAKLLLSDIDDQDSFRFQAPLIQFYRHNTSMKDKDPVKLIREALAKTLVFYYPFAGRLKEGLARKLFVDCTDEGVMFIEADADVTMEQFGHALRPPFPCVEELLYDVPGSAGILNSPLLLVQVTRLRCGGFIVALRMNHTMSDGIGVSQFMSAVSEIARGETSPSVAPVWQRDLLSAREPPRVTCKHHEYDQVPYTDGSIVSFDDVIYRSFSFGPKEVCILKKIVSPHLSKCPSTFEVITACLWKCRTIALQQDPQEDVRIICVVNARDKFNPPLPIGYYGNAVALPMALTTAGKLCNSPLDYAIQLVKKAKSDVTEEYVKSVADLMVIKGRPHVNMVGTYIVSDLTRIGYDQVDFGWGKPVYGSLTKGDVGVPPGILSFYLPSVNKKGEKEIVVPIFLPASAMERFANELHHVLRE